MGRTIVLGMGNPYLKDDSVGLRVAQALRPLLAVDGNVDVAELHAGGLRVMEALAGYERAIIVDATVTGAAPGTVRLMAGDEVRASRHIWSTHDTDLEAALELGRQSGVSLPTEITIWGIEADEVDTFGEEMTTPVAAAAERVTEQIAAILASVGSDTAAAFAVAGR